MIISLTKNTQKRKAKNEPLFFDLVKNSFIQKRKTLKNNLKGYDFNQINEILKKNNLPEDVRAENISKEVFIQISDNL